MWVNRTIDSLVIGFVLVELIEEEKPVISIDETITLRVAMSYEDEMSKEDLLLTSKRQFNRQFDDLELAMDRLKVDWV